MRLFEIAQLQEGVHDPYIFKAIFTSGGPGSGKSTVANALLAGKGLKFVDIDRFAQLAIKAGKPTGDTEYEEFWRLTQAQKTNYLLGRLGMIIDGTGKDVNRVVDQVEALREFGYDVGMIFVNTDLETARSAADWRFEKTGRRVPDARLVSSWERAQQNMEIYENYFKPNFWVYDNSGFVAGQSFQPNESFGRIEKGVNRFLSAEPSSPVAKAWIQSQLTGQQEQP